MDALSLKKIDKTARHFGIRYDIIMLSSTGPSLDIDDKKFE